MGGGTPTNRAKFRRWGAVPPELPPMEGGTPGDTPPSINPGREERKRSKREVPIVSFITRRYNCEYHHNETNHFNFFIVFRRRRRRRTPPLVRL